MEFKNDKKNKTVKEFKWIFIYEIMKSNEWWVNEVDAITTIKIDKRSGYSFLCWISHTVERQADDLIFPLIVTLCFSCRVQSNFSLHSLSKRRRFRSIFKKKTTISQHVSMWWCTHKTNRLEFKTTRKKGEKIYKHRIVVVHIVTPKRNSYKK